MIPSLHSHRKWPTRTNGVDVSRAATVYQQTAYLFPLMLLGVVVGFWPSYFMALPSTRLSFHLHSSFMLLFMVALIVQAALFRKRQMAWHRRIGKASYVLVPLMVVFSIVVIHEVLVRDGIGPASRQRLTLPLFAVLHYALTYGLAIYYRRQTQLHARYMIATGLVLLYAGTLRIFINWIPWVGNPPHANFILLEILTIALILNDRRLGAIRAPFVLTLALFMSNHALYWTAADWSWWRSLAGLLRG